MTLYHNCDYRDLPSILGDGILPMSIRRKTIGICKDSRIKSRWMDDTRHIIDLYNIVYQLN